MCHIPYTILHAICYILKRYIYMYIYIYYSRGSFGPRPYGSKPPRPYLKVTPVSAADFTVTVQLELQDPGKAYPALSTCVARERL